MSPIWSPFWPPRRRASSPARRTMSTAACSSTSAPSRLQYVQHRLGEHSILEPHHPRRDVFALDPGALQVEALGHGQDQILPPRPAHLGEFFPEIFGTP